MTCQKKLKRRLKKFLFVGLLVFSGIQVLGMDPRRNEEEGPMPESRRNEEEGAMPEYIEIMKNSLKASKSTQTPAPKNPINMDNYIQTRKIKEIIQKAFLTYLANARQIKETNFYKNDTPDKNGFEWDSINPFYRRTQQGFFLESASNNPKLWTPFGEITLSNVNQYFGASGPTHETLEKDLWKDIQKSLTLEKVIAYSPPSNDPYREEFGPVYAITAVNDTSLERAQEEQETHKSNGTSLHQEQVKINQAKIKFIKDFLKKNNCH